MSRVRADLWCAAFVRRHNDLGNMCVISRKGDPSAGQIWVEISHLNGTVSLYTPALALDVQNTPTSRVFEQRYDAVEAHEVRDRIAREIEFDPDLWVVALEMRGDAHGLELVSRS